MGHYKNTLVYKCAVPGCERLADSKETALKHHTTSHRRESEAESNLDMPPNEEIAGGIPNLRICPFCRDILARSIKSNARHVAGHLEDVTIPILTFYLGPDGVSDPDDSDCSEPLGTSYVSQEVDVSSPSAV